MTSSNRPNISALPRFAQTTGIQIMSVSDWFSTFCSNLAISNADTISVRYKRITQRLNTDFWNTTSETAHSIYVGSYGRDTAIRGKSDIDMAFWLPPAIYHQYNQHQGNGQSAFLQAVRNSIATTYPKTTAGADGQVVVINFDDGMKIEVLPCFENTSNTLTHADSNGGGSWKTTDPRAEITAISGRNINTNYNLKPLCRMMRSWRNYWSVPISGVLIDTLAYQFIDTWQYRDKSYMYYDWMSRDFFDYMASQDAKQTFWRAPSSARYVYRDGNFEYKATQCRNLAKEAIQYEADKYPTSAKSKWRDIFGSSFPS